MTLTSISIKDTNDLKRIVEALVAIDTFPNLKKWMCYPNRLDLSGHDESELFAPIPFVDWCHGNILQEQVLINGKTFYDHCFDTSQLIIKFLTNNDRENDVSQERIDLFQLTMLYPIHYYNREEDKGKSYYRNWVVQMSNCSFYFADKNLYKEGE